MMQAWQTCLEVGIAGFAGIPWLESTVIGTRPSNAPRVRRNRARHDAIFALSCLLHFSVSAGVGWIYLTLWTMLSTRLCPQATKGHFSIHHAMTIVRLVGSEKLGALINELCQNVGLYVYLKEGEGGVEWELGIAMLSATSTLVCLNSSHASTAHLALSVRLACQYASAQRRRRRRRRQQQQQQRRRRRRPPPPPLPLLPWMGHQTRAHALTTAVKL